MKKYKIEKEHIQVLKEYCAYADGYLAGAQDSTQKLKLRLIEILAAQSPASGADQEPNNADSRFPDESAAIDSTAKPHGTATTRAS